VAEDSNHSIRPYEGNDPYVFICYSHADTEVYDQIQWLQEQGVNVWYDQGITPGSEWTEALAKRIEGCSHFLYFVSQNSVESKHCRRELRFAQAEEKRILGVQLDAFELPSGIRFSLGSLQLILKHELSVNEYHSRLASALSRDAESRQPVSSGDAVPKTSGWPKWAALVLVAAAISVGGFLLYQNERASKTWIAEEQATARAPGEGKSAVAQKPSIAVLPFDNMSGDPDQDYLSDGITEEIIGGLSLNSGFAVISRNSTFFYKGKQTRIRQIEQELGADYVVEGSLRVSGDSVRITAKLIDASTDSHLWKGTYDRQLLDVFLLQDEISQRIAAALNVELGHAELSRVRRIPTQNLTALDSYWRGLDYLLRPGEDAADSARRHLEKAVELDPQFAEALVLLGWLHLRNPDPQTPHRVVELAQKAIDIDQSLPDAYRLLADVHLRMGRHEEAMIAAEKAVTLNPNDADAYHTMGMVLVNEGQFDEAIEQYAKAIQLNPRYPRHYLRWLTRAYRYTGQYDRTIAAAKRALSLNPDWAYANALLAWGYINAWATQQSNDSSYLDRGLKALREAELTPDLHHVWIAMAYLWMRQPDKAIAELATDLAKPAEADSNPYWLSQVLIYLGRYGEAISLLEDNGVVDVVLVAAYRLAGLYEKSIAASKHAVRQNLEHAGAYFTHIALAALYADLGRVEEAKAEAAEILKLVPNFSVDVWGERNPMKDGEQVERDMAALRKAGLK